MKEWVHVAASLLGALLSSGILVYIWTNKKEAKVENEKRHLENVTRLTSIETKIEPIWEWWNKTNGH